MTKIINTRVIVQHGSNLYYPKLVRAYTTAVYPYYADTATIEINTNIQPSTTTYKSPFQDDDIVRLQVNVRNSSSEPAVYQDIFEGRIMSISSKMGTDNNTILVCRGHGEETLYRAITGDENVSSTTTGSMLATFAGSYLTRLTDAGTSLIDSTNSTSITSYNIQQDTKYFVDVIRDFEGLESYGYRFSVVPTYTSGLLTATYISWQPLSSTASAKVQAREGTPRVIAADFTSSIERVIEDVTVYGISGSPQAVGTSIDGSPTYNTRHHIQTDQSLLTNQLCSDLAAALRSRFGSELIVGTISIIGDPNITPGDLIYCKFPSVVLNNASIDGNYRCKKVTHQIDAGGWVTHLDLGELIETPYDMIAGFHAKNRILDANFID